jgi:formate-dependent nitrite reductase membrane component NrfD
MTGGAGELDPRSANSVSRGGQEDARPGRFAIPGTQGSGGRRRRRRTSDDGAPVVPEAEFTSYYGRPVLKASPWEADIPAYLFLGGLAAGSSVLAAGADLTGRPSLRRTGRVGALIAITASFVALVHDLGRPARFVNMLRVAKPTSPMSVGTWILTAYGPLAAAAGAAELRPLLPLPRWAKVLVRLLGRPAGLGAAVVAPAVASYTAVLLADTATPAWHEARRELPFVFVGSAAVAAGGLGMAGAAKREAAPARRLAVAGATLELLAEHRMEQSMGLAAQALHEGKAGSLTRASKALTASGALLAGVLGRRSRFASIVAGGALLAGSACTRFAIFEAGQESARDPKYTIVPQRERVNRGAAVRADRALPG